MEGVGLSRAIILSQSTDLCYEYVSTLLCFVCDDIDRCMNVACSQKEGNGNLHMGFALSENSLVNIRNFSSFESFMGYREMNIDSTYDFILLHAYLLLGEDIEEHSDVLEDKYGGDMNAHGHYEYE